MPTLNNKRVAISLAVLPPPRHFKRHFKNFLLSPRKRPALSALQAIHALYTAVASHCMPMSTCSSISAVMLGLVFALKTLHTLKLSNAD